MRWEHPSRRFNPSWLLPSPDEEFGEAGRLFQTLEPTDASDLECQVLDEATEQLYSRAGEVCPRCGADVSRDGWMLR
jgi:hypothetical protein